MRIFKKEPDFNFMGKRFLAFALSGLIIVIGAITLTTKGFNLGIDFSGGTLIEVSFKNYTNENNLRKVLKKVGFGKSEIQKVGRKENKFFIKTIKSIEQENKSQHKSEGIIESQDLGEHEKVAEMIKSAFISDKERASLKEGKIDINNASENKTKNFLITKGASEEDAIESSLKINDLKKNETGLINSFKDLEELKLKRRVMTILKDNTFLGNFTFLSTEIVGPKVGRDLRSKAILATFWALLGMLIYIAFRFKFVYAFAAVITLFHDILIILSFILFFNVEMSLTVVAAILTLVGYSLNDTIVVFDRVRDNVKLMRREKVGSIVNKSINQTLTRTIVTSGTTLLTVLALFFFGGEIIHTFSLILIVGILIGTYSSIFQSCAWLKIWEKHFIRRKKI